MASKKENNQVSLALRRATLKSIENIPIYGRPPTGKNGEPLTNAVKCQKSRAKTRAKEREAKAAERRARFFEAGRNLGIHPLAVADIREHDLASNSVHAIITDPPYPEEDLTVYRDLGALAMRVLQPSGWCVALVGYIFLPQILNDLEASGLRWRFPLAAYFAGGGHARMIPFKLFQNWKPVVCFQKPPRTPMAEWGPDLIKVDKSDHAKDLHPWQQSTSLFRILVERFTQPGDLVVDPFAGSGTTLRAAMALGRDAWGADNGAANHLFGPS
jgi:hypothetical protein